MLLLSSPNTIISLFVGHSYVDSAKFAAEYGHSDNFDMSEVFWTCSNVFAKW